MRVFNEKHASKLFHLQPHACSLRLHWQYTHTLYAGVWMDELGFYVPSTVFQSFRDDERVNIKALCNEAPFRFGMLVFN